MENTVSMKTYSVKPADIKKQWVIVDAADQNLGRLASQVAYVLRGKHKPSFTPHMDCGDHVIVINASKINLTGNKARDKFYFHHTSYVGGIKAISAEDLLEKNPSEVIEIAVKGMLPKNKLGRQIAGHLKVYADTEHPHASQQPVPMPVRTAGK